MAAALAACGGKKESGGGEPASGSTDIKTVIEESAAFLVEEVEVDSLDAMGGGWVPLALKKSGTDAADDEYYEAYYDSVRAAAKSGKGVLSKDKPTANERVAIVLHVLGKDPFDVEGFDLLKYVDNYKKVKEQGLNAEIYALIAANATGAKLKNERRYLTDLLNSQFKNGAFGMDKDHPDSDMTAMAVQALSYYNGDAGSSASKAVRPKDRKRAAKAVEKAVQILSEQQGKDGSYGSSESTSQVILALGMIGADPLTDERFVKDGKSLYDGLLVYREGKGFCHAREENVEPEAEVLATEQALMALDQISLGTEGTVFE